MKILNKGIVISLAILLSAMFIASCEKEEVTDTRNENIEFFDKERGVAFNKIYPYSKELTLREDQYYVTIRVESNDEAALMEYIEQKPNIKNVRLYTEKSDIKSSEGEILNGDDNISIEQNNFENGIDLSISIIDHNIPKGYTHSFIYENLVETQKTSNKSSKVLESARKYSWQNTGVRGADLTMYGFGEVQLQFYSRGCCWYTLASWYHRGHRTFGLTSKSSHSFDTTKYTQKVGARISAYTTKSIWNSIEIEPRY